MKLLFFKIKSTAHSNSQINTRPILYGSLRLDENRINGEGSICLYDLSRILKTTNS